jgi:hypothetical protein
VINTPEAGTATAVNEVRRLVSFGDVVRVVLRVAHVLIRMQRSRALDGFVASKSCT